MRVYDVDDPDQAAEYAQHEAEVEQHNRGKVGTHDGAKYAKLAERRRLRAQRRQRTNPPAT